MEFFFNCQSLMLSEMADNYRRGNYVSKENHRLREQVSHLAAEKLSAEESLTHQLARVRESADGFLAAQLAAEEKLSAAEEEIRLLREQLSSSQDFLSASIETSRLAEEAKDKAERGSEDLQNQLASKDAIFGALKAELEVQAVDRFKRSPAFDALLLREFERWMRQSKKFFAMRDHSDDKALKRFDHSLQAHMEHAVNTIKREMRRWKANCWYTRTEPHPMHLEVPTKRAFNTYYSGQKGSITGTGTGVEPDLGSISGQDYEPFMPIEAEEIVWPSEDEIEDEDDTGEDPPANA